MGENADKVKKKLEEVDNLVSNFGSQSEQLETSQRKLNSVSKTLDEKVKETFKIVDNLLTESKKWYGESKRWYEKAEDDLNNMSTKIDESIEPFNNIFNETKFGEVCKELSELKNVLKDCNRLKDELFDIAKIIVDDLGKKIEDEISSVTKNQKENQRILEENFGEILKILRAQSNNDENN